MGINHSYAVLAELTLIVLEAEAESARKHMRFYGGLYLRHNERRDKRRRSRRRSEVDAANDECKASKRSQRALTMELQAERTQMTQNGVSNGVRSALV